jgi:shikimate kinase
MPRLHRVLQPLSVQLPQIGLTVLDLDDIILKQTHLEVLLIDLDGEGVADVLDGEVLPDGLELGDEEVVGSGGLFVLAQEVRQR